MFLYMLTLLLTLVPGVYRQKAIEGSGRRKNESSFSASSGLALKGEPWAIKEIADRVDGKSSLALRTETLTPDDLTLRWMT